MGRQEEGWRVEVYEKPKIFSRIRLPLIDSFVAETFGSRIYTAVRGVNRQDAYKKASEIEASKGKGFSAIPVPPSRQ